METDSCVEHHPGRNDEGEGEGEAKDVTVCEYTDTSPSSTSLISLLSLPRTHPFAGITNMEQRQQYWDDLPTYSGASICTPRDFPSCDTLDHNYSSVAEEDQRRKAICDEERPEIASNGKDMGKGKGKEKVSVLETLCCRVQTGTPVRMSRLPFRVGAVGLGRDKYKVKRGMVRMPLDSTEELGSERDIGTLGPAQNQDLCGESSKVLERREAASNHSAASSASLLLHDAAEEGEASSSSLEERLRKTTLQDLPLSLQDTAHVRALVLELVGDREGMVETWPLRSLGRSRRVKM